MTLKEKFIEECTAKGKVTMTPNNLFSWFEHNMKPKDIIVKQIRKNCFNCKHDLTGNIVCRDCNFSELNCWEAK